MKNLLEGKWILLKTILGFNPSRSHDVEGHGLANLGTTSFNLVDDEGRKKKNKDDDGGGGSSDLPLSISSFDIDQPTEEDRATLRIVSDKIPWAAFLVALIELCERFTYYGLSGPFQNYIQNPYKSKDIPGALGKLKRNFSILLLFFFCQNRFSLPPAEKKAELLTFFFVLFLIRTRTNRCDWIDGFLLVLVLFNANFGSGYFGSISREI